MSILGPLTPALSPADAGERGVRISTARQARVVAGRALQARTRACLGVDPVQRLNARWNALSDLSVEPSLHRGRATLTPSVR